MRHWNSAVEDEIEAHSRGMLADRLEQLTAGQMEMFTRIYPHGVKAKDLVSAIGLCDRTIRQNNGVAFPFAANPEAK
jgi:hypothetical protein